MFTEVAFLTHWNYVSYTMPATPENRNQMVHRYPFFRAAMNTVITVEPFYLFVKYDKLS